jgi:prepilin-type N-terminal cleavage/methylation domain-containing protein
MRKSRRNSQRKYNGFTLIELLVVIAIIVILALTALIVINPLELQRRSRDGVRVSDLANINQAIQSAVAEASGSASSVLCFNTTAPCT